MAFVAVNSCVVTKPYEKPDHMIQETHFRTDQLPQDSLSMANVSWRNMFTDPLLQGYIEHGLQNNIDIRTAIQQINISQSYLKQGKAAFLPSVSGNLNYQLSRPSKNGSQGAALKSSGKKVLNDFSIGGSASWEADIWGKIKSQENVFQANYLQSVAAHQAVTTQIVANIANLYYQLTALDAQMKVTQESIATRKQSFETTKALKDAGVGTVTSTAVQQTEAQYLDAQAILVGLQQQAHILENAMCLLMGDEPHSIARNSLDGQNISTDLKIGVPAQLLANRPDVMAAEDAYRSAFELTNVAWTNFYPSLTIGASTGLESLTFDKWFNGGSVFGNLVGGLTAPIFNQRKIRTQYEVSQAQQEQAKLNYRKTLIQASQEVSDALFSYESATKLIALDQQQQNLLQQAVIDSQELLKSGYNNFSYLEVLSAQQNVLSSSLAVINDRLAQLTGVVNLYQALGGGWR